MNLDIKIPITIKVDDVRDLLRGALKGGSNYWYMIVNYVYPKGVQIPQHPHIDLPFLKDGAIIIEDKNSIHAPKLKYRLDIAALQNGLEIFSKKYPLHFSDFIAGEWDASTSDVFLQCCLFYEARYG